VTAPNVIWLQWGDEAEDEYVYPSEGVTWCSDQINDTDVRYVRADVQPAERWEPVALGEKIDVAGIIGRRILYRMDEDTLAILTIEHNTVHAAEMLQLPADLRLCRRVEGAKAPEASGPAAPGTTEAWIERWNPEASHE